MLEARRGEPEHRPYLVESALLQADRIALSLRGALERTAVPLASAAARSVATKAWCDFGFARLDDYARERLGRSGRWVRDLAALGDGLRSFPGLAAAMTGEDGGRPIGRVAALLVARVASHESLGRWIASARAMSIRALRDAVRAARSRPPEESPDATPPAPDTTPPDVAVAVGDDDDAADRLLVRLMVPPPVLAAFDEAVDLFRALEGGQATVASFVEALVAEASARCGDARGGDSPVPARPAPISRGEAASPTDADLRVLEAGPEVAATERALAASTANWRHLPGHIESSWALALAGVTLARFRALADEAGRGGAVDLDRQLRALVDIENELEARLGAILADLVDRRAWPRLRFAGVGHYGEERLGLSRTTAEDRARLARDLRRFPRLRDAYDTGRLGRESTALVARLLRDAPFGRDPDGAASGADATTALEAAWVARATESTVKRMRDEARALGRYRVLGPRLARAEDDGGNGTGSGSGEAARGGEGARCPGVSVDGAPLDDADWHASLRREPGLARRRLRLFGALALSSPDVFQGVPHAADTYLRLRLPHDLGRQFLAMVDAERRRISAAADAIPWDAGLVSEAGADSSAHPGVHGGASWLAARMFSIRCRRVPAWVGLLALLEDFAATWDCEDALPRRPGDEIYVRDGWRCAAPGCTSRRNLEDHHLHYRSRGGGDDAANRLCLCRFHHQRGEHGGLASCRGKAPTGVVWRLGRRDSAPAWYRNERLIDERLAGEPDAARGAS